jgi:hypothetical protein
MRCPIGALRMVRTSGGRTVRGGGVIFSRYRTFARFATAAFGLAVVGLFVPTPAAFAQPAVRVSFDGFETDKLPSGWVTRGGKAGDVYSLRVEEGRRFLHADSRSSAIQIGRELRWPLKEMPTLEWQWRAVTLPPNGDERNKTTDDSVLGVYVIFGHIPFLKTIKYVWSNVVPVGTVLDSPFSSSTKVIVLESGQGLAGRWVTEKRDVLADYRRLFGEGEANPVAQGIGLLTDADNTHSHAVGDYCSLGISGPGQNEQSPATVSSKGTVAP